MFCDERQPVGPQASAHITAWSPDQALSFDFITSVYIT